MTSSVHEVARLRRLISSGEARRRRIAANLSLREVAEDVRVTHGSIWNWETGRQRPSGAPAIRYLATLDALAVVAKGAGKKVAA